MLGKLFGKVHKAVKGVHKGVGKAVKGVASGVNKMAKPGGIGPSNDVISKLSNPRAKAAVSSAASRIKARRY